MSDTPTLWTIEELCAQAALALASDYVGAPNARIRDVPDLRTLRYYTTLGLLDRPAELKGRTGFYGRKHLLQVVAVKRLQTQGLSLAEIQQRLLGKSEKELMAIAQVSEKPAKPARREFWKREEEQKHSSQKEVRAEKDSKGGEQTELPVSTEAAGLSSNSPSIQGGVFALQGIPLRENVTLLFSPSRPLTAEDVQALQAAAGPLLKYLEKRRLLDPPTQKETP